MTVAESIITDPVAFWAVVIVFDFVFGVFACVVLSRLWGKFETRRML